MTDTTDSREEGDARAPEQAAAMLREMIGLMGFEAEVEPVDRSGETWLRIESQDASRLIGREGQTLDALQLLLNRMMVRRIPERIRFTLDVGDYRERHLRQLQLTARDAADVVRQSGRPITLDPMPASERRVIHQALKEVAGIETVSVEEQHGGFKSIMIRPAEEE